ncbi:MAG: hypothetical protein KC620_00040 [Myxococcales bacterium]|nr:hypothetical protein [Myxococcales bacterium]
MILHGIVEGPTDAVVLKGFAAEILGTTKIIWTTLQPEVSLAFGHPSQGRYGGGWKGVRGKCREIAALGGVVAAGVLENVDALIVHLDGEVAEEAEVNVAKPCPPAMATATELMKAAQGWLGEGSDHRKVVYAIPCMETEAWLLPGLRPTASLELCVECSPKPSVWFQGGRPKLVEQSGKKKRRVYEQSLPAIRKSWPAASRLSTAEAFATRLVDATDRD